MRIALLHTRVRVEERMLLDAFESRGVDATPIDLRSSVFDLDRPEPWRVFDLALDRSMSLNASRTAARTLEAFGVRCLNSADAVEAASDKLRTSLSLVRDGVPTPRVCVAPDPAGAVEAIESIGYPAVLKPTIGSWGRLVVRVRDRDAAEAVIEHRAALGSAPQRVCYVQEHIDKPGRDIRVFVVGGEAICAIARASDHWLTNTARGAVASAFTVTQEVGDLSERAAASVGAEIAAVDLLECPRRGLLVNEVNHSMEFRNSVHPTGVDIPGRVVAYAIAQAERAQAGAAS